MAKKEKEEKKKKDKERRGAALSNGLMGEGEKTECEPPKSKSGAAAVGMAAEVLVAEDFLEGGSQTVSISKGAGLVTLTKRGPVRVDASPSSSSSSSSSSSESESESDSN